MADQTFSLSKESPLQSYQPDPGGMSLQEITLPAQQEPIPDPGGYGLENTVKDKEIAEDTLRMYLSTVEDPKSEEAKIATSRFYSAKTGIPFDVIYKDYDQIAESILGMSLEPKAAMQFLSDGWTTGRINQEISDLGNQKLALPLDQQESLNREIARLEDAMPVYDPYKHNIVLDASETAISMAPYILDVGKWAVPGALISVGAGLLSGGTGTIPAAATVLKTVGRLVSIWGRAKSFEEGYISTTGSSYNAFQNLKDENGNPIDDGIARKVTVWSGIPMAGIEAIGGEYFFTGNSVFKKLAEKMGYKAIKERLQGAASKVLIDLTVKDFFADQAKKMSMRTGEMLVHEILMEEYPQYIMDIQATEMAKHFTNDLTGAEFADITSEEFLAGSREVLVESFKGMFMLGLARNVPGSMIDFGRYARGRETDVKATESAEALEGKEALSDIYSNPETDEETLSEIETMQEEKLKISDYEKPEIKVTDNKVTATTMSGELVGTATFTEIDNTIQLEYLDDMSEANTERVMAEIEKSFPNKQVVLSPNAVENSPAARAIEDLNPDLAEQNISIEGAKRTIKSAEKYLEESTTIMAELKEELTQVEDQANTLTRITQLEKAMAEQQENIDISNETITRATEAKAEILKPKKEAKDMTREEYAEEFPLNKEVHLKDTKEGKDLRSKLSEYSNIREEELDISLDLVDMIARAKNTTPVKWLKKHFKDGVVTKQDKGETRASADLRVAGEGIIKLAKESDFSSWVHELAHVFRLQLEGKDLAVATVWAEDQTGDIVKSGKWTVEMEEAFAAGFEQYIKEGSQNKPIDSIWAKMATFMRRIYETLRDAKNLPTLSPEIIEVFENQLAPSRLEALKEGTSGLELFQPKHKEAIKKAVKEGRTVSRETLEAMDEDWAKEEILKQETEKAILEDFDFLIDPAMMAKDVDAFLEEAPLIISEDAVKLNGKTKQWLRDLYELATKEETTDINTGNKKWVAGVNEDYTKEFIIGVSKDVSGADAIGVPSLAVMAARRYLSTKDFRPRTLVTLEKTLKKNPAEYREMAASFMDDMDEIRQIEAEKAFSEDIGIEEDLLAKKLVKERRDIADELDDAVLEKMVRLGTISAAKAEKLMSQASKEIKAIRDNIDKLEKDIVAWEQKYSDKLDVMIASRKKELLAQKEVLKTALAKQKAELKAKVKAKKEKADAKKHMEKLGKQVTKAPSMTVDANYRNMIYRIQGKVDKKYRRKSTLTERQALRDIYEQNPELAKILPKGALNAINAKALNEWTALELEALKEKIDQLTYQGKMLKKMRDVAKTVKKDADIQTGVTQLKKHGIFTDAAISNGEAKTKKEKGMEYMLKTFRMNRVIDMLDAGKTWKGEEFNGPIYRIVWDGITDAYNQEIREKARRELGIKKAFKEFGITRDSLRKTVDAEGLKWSKDVILDIWAGWQNEKKQIVLEENNKITPELYKELVSHLTENELKLGQYILDDYTESFERLQEAYYLDKNILLEAEENYSPIRVIMNGMTAEELDMHSELMGRKNIRTTLQKGMTKKRVNHDHKIQLGLMETWVGAMQKEEHYINNVEALKHIKGVLNNKEFVSTVASVHKSPMLKEINLWLDRYTNPLANKSNKGWDRVIRVLKKNAAIAYLWGNMATILKQIPSIAYFVAYSGPDFFTGIFSNQKETQKLMDKWSPELTHGRSFEAFVDSLKEQATSQGRYYIDKMGELGLRGIQMMDKTVITAGWRGVYENNRRHGLSEQESARKATQAVLLTQPASGVKDTAAIYADDNMLSMMLMFTNQLNQIFLNLFYDAPQALLHGRTLKGMEIYMASMVGALTLWMISNRRLPEDEEDWIDVVSDQFLSVIPGIGKLIGSNVDGYDLSIPALAPVDAMAAIFKLGKKAATGKDITKPQIERALKTMYEGFAIGVGVPYTAIDRIYRGFQEGIPLETIMFGGEFNVK